MKKRSLSITAVVLLGATCAWAEQDFYGIRMKNERWAKNLVWNARPAADPADLKEGPVLSHDITAEASLKEIADGRIDFRVTVFNGTAAPIPTDFHFRDFFITTRNGQKFPLIDTQDRPELETIEPKSSVTFTPSLGNLRMRNKDVMLIECSFDLGKTKVFLFPWSQKDAVTKLVSPVAVDEPSKDLSTRSRGSNGADVQKGNEPTGSKRTFLEWISGKDKPRTSRKGISPEQPESSAPPEKLKSAPVPAKESPSAVQTQPASNSRLDSAIKNFVYVPADAAAKPGSAPRPAPSSASSASNPAASGAPRSEAHVISFNKAYNFVTLNLGSRDGLRSNMILSILRDGKPVAKARVKELREAVSAAALIPETIKSEIRAGDQVSIV